MALFGFLKPLVMFTCTRQNWDTPKKKDHCQDQDNEAKKYKGTTCELLLKLCLGGTTFQIGIMYSVPHKIHLCWKKSVYQQNFSIVARIICI